MNINHQIDIQLAVDNSPYSEEQLSQWIVSVLNQLYEEPIALTLRIVDEDEIKQLNSQYRQKDKVTNVLSFEEQYPAEIAKQMESKLIGDIIICAQVVKDEAKIQGKTLEAHWKHMITHGILHLAGYDHTNESDANEMETLEIKILDTMQVSNPY